MTSTVDSGRDMEALVEPSRPKERAPVAGADAHAVRQARNRFVRACAVGSALAAVVFAWLVSEGTWNLFQPGFSTNFYDVQARSLLAGHLSMPSGVLGVEAFYTGSRSYMYFGPVPALLRIPLLLMTHRVDGRLTGVSMLLADIVALAFTSGIAWQVRRLVRGSDEPVSRTEAIFTGVALFVVGCGSSLLYLTSRPSVYDEAEIWGIALALGAIYFMIRFLTIRTARNLLLMAVFCALTLYTRAPLGFGAIFVVLMLGAIELTRVLKQPGWPFRWALGLGAAALIPLGTYAIVNDVKFHMLYGLPLARSASMHYLGYRIPLRANGGTFFRFHFLPTNLLAYLRPDGVQFTSWFPWVTYRMPTTIGHLVYGGIEPPVSVVAAMPALVVLAVIGVVTVLRRRPTFDRSGRRGAPASATPGPDVLRIPMVGMTCAAAPIFVFGYLAGRYVGDLMPILVLAATVGFAVVAANSRRTRWRTVLASTLCALALFGTWTVFSLTLLYQGASPATFPLAPARAHFVSLREAIGGTAGFHRVHHLPRRPGPFGTFVVTGHCSALYESNGVVFETGELSHSAGHFRFEVSAPSDGSGRSWPLLASGHRGAADVLALHELGGGVATVTYQYDRWTPISLINLTDQTLQMVPGHRYVIDASLDARTGTVSVGVDGTNNGSMFFFGGSPIHSGPVEVARDSFGTTGVAASFPGRVRQLPVATPSC